MGPWNGAAVSPAPANISPMSICNALPMAARVVVAERKLATLRARDGGDGYAGQFSKVSQRPAERLARAAQRLPKVSRSSVRDGSTCAEALVSFKPGSFRVS
jgi:hypothetical protein